MTRIGFVGLGNMGLPMAIHLVKAGFEVMGYDLNPKALGDFVEAGGQATANLKTLAQGQDILITMLQTGEQVQAVCLGQDGLFAHAPKGALFIDCSSIAVKASRDIQAQARRYGLDSIDAPVSGGVGGAKAASLTFMVGGPHELVNRARPILNLLGKKIIHTGDMGSGMAAKICNNMILGVSMIAISEAFLLAEKLGLSAEKLFEVVNNASGQCWAMSNYVPLPGILPEVPANHDYKAGFSAKMMLKDLRLSQDSAESTALSTPLAQSATALYESFVAMGDGEQDFSAIINTLR